MLLSHKLYFKTSKKLITFFKFGLVGALTAIIYFLIMLLLNNIFRVYYIIALSIAYLISTTFHYYANKNFTFKSINGGYFQVIKYLVMWIINYLITLLIVSYCVEKLNLMPFLGVCFSVLVTVGIGFTLSKLWVFK